MKSLILSLSKLLILLSGLALSVPAQALTLEQATKLVSFLNSTTTELAQAKTNLLQMSSGMPLGESIQIDTIYDSITTTDCYFQKLNIVTNIYSLMQDSRDQAISKNYINLIAKHTVTSANTTINVLNRQLATIRSPAAIAEAQKIRDLVQKIRDEIQRTVPGS